VRKNYFFWNKKDAAEGLVSRFVNRAKKCDFWGDFSYIYNRVIFEIFSRGFFPSVSRFFENLTTESKSLIMKFLEKSFIRLEL